MRIKEEEYTGEDKWGGEGEKEGEEDDEDKIVTKIKRMMMEEKIRRCTRRSRKGE
jgi:hypothetical protein